jgi:RNA polymerase sigma-70 factor (ECF subfamily)
MCSDEDLMAAYTAGDESAFAQLFDRYSESLRVFFMRSCHCGEEPDLVQRVFMQLHRHREQFDASLRLRPWLYAIAWSVKHDHLRERRRRPLDGVEYDDSVGLPADDWSPEEADRRQQLRAAVESLPAAQRTAIQLHWFEGLSFPEVARELGLSVTVVKVRAHRGYCRLRDVLAPF